MCLKCYLIATKISDSLLSREPKNLMNSVICLLPRRSSLVLLPSDLKSNNNDHDVTIKSILFIFEAPFLCACLLCLLLFLLFDFIVMIEKHSDSSGAFIVANTFAKRIESALSYTIKRLSVPARLKRTAQILAREDLSRI